MGLLRDVFQSPQRAQSIYDIGQARTIQPTSRTEPRYDTASLTHQVASIEKWLLVAYREGVIINDNWVTNQVYDRGILVFEDMLEHDPHVFACFETLAGSAAKAPFVLKAGTDDGIAKEHAEFIRAAFDRFDLVSALMEIAHGEATGYSVCETVLSSFLWRGKKKLTIRSQYGAPGVVRIDPSRIIFDYLQRPKLISIHDPIIGAFLAPFGKYLVYKRGSSPYGDALLMHAFQPYWWKQNGNVFLAKYLELFGVPPIIAYHKNPDELAKNLAMLQQLRNSSLASFPTGVSNENPLTVLQPGRDSATLNNSLDFYNDEITKAILGGTRTMSRASDGGAYSATEAHGDQAQDRIDNIVRRLTFILNEQLIPFLIRINFGSQRHYPRADFGIDEEETPNEYMGRVGIWAKSQVPIPISETEFYAKSGFAKPVNDNDRIYPAASSLDAAPLQPLKFLNA